MLQHYLIQVDPRRIKFNPLNPRKHRGTEYVRLKESIERIGIIQPPIVRVLPHGWYEVIDGEGRVSVAQESGLETIRVISVGIVDDQEALVLLQASNTLRSFNFLAECKGLASLHRQGLNFEQLVKQFGSGEAKIRTMVAIGYFPTQLLARIEEHILLEKQAEVWTPALLAQVLLLRELLPGKNSSGPVDSFDNRYDYSEVSKAIEKVISGDITDKEQMHTYVVNRRYEIYQARFDQDLQRKLEEELAAAKQELDAAKDQQIFDLERRGEQQLSTLREEYENKVALLQAQYNRLQKRHNKVVNDAAKIPEALKEREREAEAALEKTQQERQELARLRQRLENEAEQARAKLLREERERQAAVKQQFDLEMAARREAKEREFAQLEGELKEDFEQKKQEIQLKAENTIEGLLSHAKKQLAEAQRTIDHIVSPSMIDGVRELGGARLKSFLWAMQDMKEALERAERKLTYSDAMYVEGERVNGRKQTSGELY
jgi:ParB-like chromosome segregation protein Spo0J